MSTNYALASQCQLRRDELGELLALATIVESHSKMPSSVDGGVGNNSISTESSDRNAIVALWHTFLTSAHVRSLTTDTLVRVSIPKSKQQLLIHDNEHIRPAAQSSESTKNKQQYYRLGSVMTIVPHPRAVPENQQTTATNANDVGTAAHLSSWLLQINFGDVAELLSAKYVSNEPFTAEEHTVYVRSYVAKCLNSNIPLSSTSYAEVVARNVKDIHRFVEAVKVHRKGNGETALQPSSGVTLGATKRLRSEVGDVGDGVDNDSDDDDFTHRTVGNGYGSDKHDRQAKLVEDQERRLVALRQHLNSKNNELQRLLQAQKRAAADHLAQQEQWNIKAESQGTALRRAEKELVEERAKRQQQQEKTDKLITQLKRLAEQTRKFKDVSDTVAEWLCVSSRQPEEVRARVQEKMAENKN
ncbi:hypothetical protein, conserved [Trypanosoma brucei gambiense DAL972]|uniref:Uncharacterized protein n=2 Tax=Trypanosoma brucei TaxID=5691 RepID=D0A9B2_TRYB9|nr:hypothetical protein, conserved [Trypanosoma brucei gambiense DAL972]RHW68089.1 hypothetical protein DPX39_110101300 [Trypanosoma brucei equiperdum]CBH18263.1 hypothetical protein, conserved [Trypanosoma brucei gambiense DAL972]|eukprot:XP_011780527.1 hypothetical protein, conserved [Trypanosoma brucei gambiense DAL972]